MIQLNDKLERAFAELEREGLVLTQRTTGRMVTEDASRVEQTKRQLAAAAIQHFWINMRKLGFAQKEALQLLQQSGTEKKEEG